MRKSNQCKKRANDGYALHFWRVCQGCRPSVFRSAHGLIAALGTIAKEEITDESLSALLDVASAKFIMSLTGLSCSILFGFVLRSGLGRREAPVAPAEAIVLQTKLNFDVLTFDPARIRHVAHTGAHAIVDRAAPAAGHRRGTLLRRGQFDDLAGIAARSRPRHRGAENMAMTTGR